MKFLLVNLPSAIATQNLRLEIPNPSKVWLTVRVIPVQVVREYI